MVGRGYLFAEAQLVYSIAPADWAYKESEISELPIIKHNQIVFYLEWIHKPFLIFNPDQMSHFATVGRSKQTTFQKIQIWLYFANVINYWIKTNA